MDSFLMRFISWIPTNAWTLICTKGNPALLEGLPLGHKCWAVTCMSLTALNRSIPTMRFTCNPSESLTPGLIPGWTVQPLQCCLRGHQSHSAFGYSGELYIFGGYNARVSRHFHGLWMYNPVSFTWEKIEPKGKGPCPRWHQCCCSW